MTVLTTPRLSLRPLTPADLPAVLAYRNDPQVARYQGWALPATLEAAAALVADAPLGTPGWVQRGVWAGARLAGDVALNTDCWRQQAELGVTLAAWAQGQGYAAEALRAVMAHAFDDLGLHRLQASADPRNGAVARLLTRLGFRHEGTSLRSCWHRDEWADDARYGLLRSEWTP